MKENAIKTAVHISVNQKWVVKQIKWASQTVTKSDL